MVVLIAGLHDTAADVQMLEAMGVEARVVPVGLAGDLKTALDNLDPASVDAFRIGPLDHPDIVEILGDFLGRIRVPVVLQVPLSHAHPELGDAIRDRLLPRTSLIASTDDEASVLLGVPMQDRVDMRRAGRTLAHLGVRAALIRSAADDLLWVENRDYWLPASSMPLAVAAVRAAGRMAQGEPVSEAARKSLQD